MRQTAAESQVLTSEANGQFGGERWFANDSKNFATAAGREIAVPPPEDGHSTSSLLSMVGFRFLPHTSAPKDIRLLLELSYYLEPLSPFLLFPIEGLLELYTKEGGNFSRISLEADKLMSCHLDWVADSIRRWALWCAASVARTGMYAS
jgi:hypothetical protein